MLTDKYTKHTIDTNTLKLKAGSLSLIEEDIDALKIMSTQQLLQLIQYQEMIKQLIDDDIAICEDIKKLLARMSVDSSFVDQIEEIIRMGGDLVDISIEYRTVWEESDDNIEIIEKATGFTSESDITEVVSNSAEKAAEVIFPPDKEQVIAAVKEQEQAVKEQAKEEGISVKDAATGLTDGKADLAEAAKETATEVQESIDKALEGITVDATKMTENIDKAEISGTAKAASATAAGIIGGVSNAKNLHEVYSYSHKAGKAISTIGKMINGGYSRTAGAIARGLTGALSGILSAGITTAVELGMEKLLEEDRKNDERIVQEAANAAVQAYIDALNNGGSRADAVAAAKDAFSNTTYIPAVDEGVIHIEGTNVGQTEYAGIVNDVITAIETQVADAIHQAGESINDYFGGCGCDDSGDCPDCGCDDSSCGSDCSSDCGCNDSGSCPDSSCVSDISCDLCVDCSNDGCSDCSSDCSNDGYCDCSSDCSNDGCSDSCDCPNDGYCDCGCDDSVCGSNE